MSTEIDTELYFNDTVMTCALMMALEGLRFPNDNTFLALNVRA